ncbi:uncharacterized protein B0T15DRAFT_322837 [Chaetomium strumarium]|uniref:Cell cycle control protein n=1 Tax=Chaetomium strumarium TaxID=1170767 RepID=A0AAJ0GKT3_9PEZI|nr:hypothetical protein B0T15DRAFT_322837 [Chaetomium strumarium]
MDLHNATSVLEDLPSDAFDLDDFEQPRSVSDYSSWPAESSPDPWEQQEEDVEYSEDELDQDFEEHDEEDEESSAHGEAVYNDEEEDIDIDYEPFAAEGEDGDEIRSLEDHFWGEEGLFDQGAENGSQRSSSLSPIPGFAAFLAELQAHQNADRLSEAPSESLFVDDGPDLLPPIDSIISSVRRTMSEIQQGRRNQLLRSLEQSRSSANSLGRLGALGRSREGNRQDHRHHPYNMPREAAREHYRMDDQENNRNNRQAHDELVAMVVRPVRSRISRRRSQAQPEVIDLTAEPDSPVLTRAPDPPQGRVPNASSASQSSARNPRRQLSLSQRTPSLSRSDASLIGNNPNFIDLTGDDPPPPPPLPQQLPRRDWNHPDHRAHPQRRQHIASSRSPAIDLVNDSDNDDLRRSFVGFVRRAQNFNIFQRFIPHGLDVLQIGGHGLNMDNPLADNIPNLNYRANGNNVGLGASKPDHVPPSPAREGFTRNTGPDTVVVCPGCGGELKYDPDSGAEDALSPRPNKKARTKKDQEEHYFWALKDCGHVYCKECYESRGLKAGRKGHEAHFRRDAENNRKVFCAVEGCSTEANNKLNWVGLFL